VPGFSIRTPNVRCRGCARLDSSCALVFVRPVFEGDAVDILFLMVFGVFLLLTLALVAGCAALERKK
jgi:hypothetical protein